MCEMKDAEVDSPTYSASSDMEADSWKDQSSQFDIASAYEDFSRVIAGQISWWGRGEVKVRGNEVDQI